MALKKRTIVVTGGGSGVGLAIARAFVDGGDNVVIAGRNAEKLAAASKDFPKEQIRTFCGDVSQGKTADDLIRFAESQFGPIDVLVNNAGANIKERAFHELTTDSWQGMIDANLKCAFECSRAVLPGMKKQKNGLIVFINSVSGKRGNPLGGAAYCAAKFGLDGMAAALANEERESGIRITSIFPGEIDTPILDHRPSPVSAEHRAKILKPEDVASCVKFVAGLPAHVHVPELIVKPNWQVYF